MTAYRWIILLNFSSVIFNNTLVTVGFAVLTSEVSLAFGVDQMWVVALITLPQVFYIPMSLVIAWMFNNLKTNHVVYIGALFQLIGSWLRVLTFLDNESIVPLYVGTALFVMATPMSLNGIGMIANLWFPDE